MATVGQYTCAQRHRAVIVDRGGGRKIVQLKSLGEVRWTRTLSNISAASVELYGDECRKQAEALAKIEPRRHELVIFRDSERVWEGPITEIEYGVDRVAVKASDVVEYLAGTALTKYWPNAEDGGTDLMTSRVSQILNHELNTAYSMKVGSTTRTFQRWEKLSPPANVLPFVEVRPSLTLRTTSSTLPFEMTVAEYLLSLSKLGLNFTVIGRKLLVWDSAKPIGQTRALAASDLGGEPNVYVTSSGFAAVQHVIGQPEPGQAPDEVINIGSAGTVDPYYGAWTRIESNPAEESLDVDPATALASQADRLYQNRKVLPVDIRVPSGGSLRLGKTLALEQLVPGVDAPVRASLYGRDVTRMQQFTQIEVSETKDGETITGTLATKGGGDG